MKRAIFLLLVAITSSASAETYVGQIQKAVGQAYWLEGKPCMVVIEQRSSDQALFRFSVGNTNASPALRTASRDNIIGLEHFKYDLSDSAPVERVADSRILRQERLMLKFDGESRLKIKASQDQWEPDSFYRETLYEFQCEARLVLEKVN